MKRVMIEFEEQSKCVVANVTIEYHGDDIPHNMDILIETKQLFDEANKYALTKTMAKNK